MRIVQRLASAGLCWPQHEAPESTLNIDCGGGQSLAGAAIGSSPWPSTLPSRTSSGTPKRRCRVDYPLRAALPAVVPERRRRQSVCLCGPVAVVVVAAVPDTVTIEFAVAAV